MMENFQHNRSSYERYGEIMQTMANGKTDDHQEPKRVPAEEAEVEAAPLKAEAISSREDGDRLKRACHIGRRQRNQGHESIAALNQPIRVIKRLMDHVGPSMNGPTANGGCKSSWRDRASRSFVDKNQRGARYGGSSSGANSGG